MKNGSEKSQNRNPCGSCANGPLRVIKCCNARQDLAFQELQRCPTSSAAVRHLVNRIVLLARSGGVASSNDRDGSSGGDLDDLVHHALGAGLEGSHLEDPHRTVPHDGLGLSNG